MSGERITCDRCRMTFPVKEPTTYGDERFARCSEPGCGKRFWHTDHKPGCAPKVIAIGILPDDVGEWRASRLSVASLGRDENFP